MSNTPPPPLTLQDSGCLNAHKLLVPASGCLSQRVLWWVTCLPHSLLCCPTTLLLWPPTKLSGANRKIYLTVVFYFTLLICVVLGFISLSYPMCHHNIVLSPALSCRNPPPTKLTPPTSPRPSNFHILCVSFVFILAYHVSLTLSVVKLYSFSCPCVHSMLTSPIV